MAKLNADFTQSVIILILSTVLVASFSLLVWVVPFFFNTEQLKAESTAKPLTALQVAGRDIYISEGLSYLPYYDGSPPTC